MGITNLSALEVDMLSFFTVDGNGDQRIEITSDSSLGGDGFLSPSQSLAFIFRIGSDSTIVGPVTLSFQFVNPETQEVLTKSARYTDQGIDSDADGFLDTTDLYPFNGNENADSDEDGLGDNGDAFPANPLEQFDTDGDGIGDNGDAFPLDATETVDTDSDGLGNNADSDDDADGVGDASDAFPLDATETADTDGDGLGNNADTDDDGDGVEDGFDAFPLDATETVDTDSDGLRNNADSDDDNDGVLDSQEALDGTNPLLVDSDADNVSDGLDAFPLDANETTDTDGDGTGDNADTDDDNDGLLDTLEQIEGSDPLLADTDADGVDDMRDAFPLDATETLDTDGDGRGNNVDYDDDDDRAIDDDDAFPLDATESVDTDADGVGDNGDAFPLDPTETMDTDGDGVGNNADLDDDADGVMDNASTFLSSGNVYGAPLDLTNNFTVVMEGTEGHGVTTDGTYVYACADPIQRLAIETGIVDDLSSSSCTYDLTTDGDYLYYLSGIEGRNQIDKRHLSSGLITENVATTSASMGLAVDGDTLFIFQRDGDTEKVDLADNSKTYISTGGSLRGALTPTHLFLSENSARQWNRDTGETTTWVESWTEAIITDGLYAYAVFGRMEVKRIDLVTGLIETIASIPEETGNENFRGLTTDGQHLYVAVKDGSVLKLEGATNASKDDNCPVAPNADQLNTDGDMAGDACDAFPDNPTETLDTDGDSLGNNADTDDDGDGVDDNLDAFPLDDNEIIDTDNDGIGNNADNDDDGDDVTDTQEALDGTDPLDRYACNGCFDFDIDIDGDTAALTDGLLVLRHLFGFAGETLTDGAIATSATRFNATTIASYLETNEGHVDIDGDGATEALTDGLLLLRYLFGFDGTTLIQGAVGTFATRTTAEEIKTYIEARIAAGT